LQSIEEELYKARVVATLNDEEKKEELLEGFSSGAKIIILSTIKDDKKKLEELSKILGEEKNKKINYREREMYDAYKGELLAGLGNDDDKLNFLPIIDECYFYFRKIFGKEHYKAKVIASLKSENKKIKLLKEINEEVSKAEIIASLSYDKKMELLERINCEDGKVKIIVSLTDDDKKIELLSEVKDEHNKVLIIRSFSDDKKKIEELKLIKNERAQAEIIASLSDDKIKLRFLKTKFLDVNNSVELYYRTKIIKKLTSDQIKLELLEAIKNETYRAEIIASLGNGVIVPVKKQKIIKEIMQKSNIVAEQEQEITQLQDRLKQQVKGTKQIGD